MRLYILSLLAVSSVHSLALGYPYRSELLAYSPARGEFPVQNALAQGYIRYIDANGAERLVGYNYPEPLYGVRRLSYGEEDIRNPLLRATIQPDSIGQAYVVQESNDVAKEREEHFRAWCQQRYQALMAEVDKLRAEGREPSADIMAQLKPLEKIVTAAGYNTINADTVEEKRAREEHLRIWNEARLKVLQLQTAQLQQSQQSQGDAGALKTYAVSYEAASPIAETAEQKKAREEHLRIYNEQLLRVQQLQAERLQENERKPAEILVKEAQSSLPINEKLGQVVMETPEVTRAKEEHLRLWNEAKLRAEQTGYKYASPATAQAGVKLAQEQPAQPLITLKGSSHAANAIEAELKPVQETAEVIRAREEHLKLVNEAKLQAQAASGYKQNDRLLYQAASTQGLQQSSAADAVAVLRIVPGIQQPAQPDQTIISIPVQQTAEGSLLKSSWPATGAQQVQDLPEVVRAREEHFKLVQEAKLRGAQYTETTDEGEQLKETERLQAEKRLLEEERIRLQQEDERRTETERLEEAKLMKDEELLREKERQNELNQLRGQQQQSSEVKAAIPTSLPAVLSSSSSSILQAGTTYLLSEQGNENPFLVRIAVQSDGAAAAPAPNQAYQIGSQTSELSNLNAYYLPAGSSLALLNPENPFLVRYAQYGGLAAAGAQNPQAASLKAAQPQPQPQLTALPQSTNTGAQLPAHIGATAAAAVKTNYGNAAELSELEKATREHFRAHEIALEQLRLANLNSGDHKDCSHQ